MSNLRKARSQINSLNSLLKQGKPLAGVMAVNEAIQSYLRSSLMQSEKKEFQEMVENAVYKLNSNAQLRELYPVLLEYEPGKEKELLEYLRELIETLQENVTAQAKESFSDIEKRKKEALQEASDLIQAGNFEKADAVFRKLEREFEGDFELKIKIADILLDAEQYQKAIVHLKNAYKDNSSSVHVFNRLGMALRKLGRLDDAEKAYRQALKLCPKDEYLHFNLGRVYLENKSWEKAMHSAERAVSLNPDFNEAEKLRHFAQKKTENKS